MRISNTTRDEFSVYGKHTANGIGNSERSHQKISIAQHHIEQICFTIIMGAYSRNNNFGPQYNSVPQNPLALVVPLNNSVQSYWNAALQRHPCRPLLLQSIFFVFFLHGTIGSL